MKKKNGEADEFRCLRSTDTKASPDQEAQTSVWTSLRYRTIRKPWYSNWFFKAPVRPLMSLHRAPARLPLVRGYTYHWCLARVLWRGWGCALVSTAQGHHGLRSDWLGDHRALAFYYSSSRREYYICPIAVISRALAYATRQSKVHGASLRLTLHPSERVDVT